MNQDEIRQEVSSELQKLSIGHCVSFGEEWLTVERASDDHYFTHDEPFKLLTLDEAVDLVCREIQLDHLHLVDPS